MARTRFRPVRPHPPPGTRTLLAPATDMTWQGMFKLPPSGISTDQNAGGPGTNDYSPCPVAIRYVGGERRLLTVLKGYSGSPVESVVRDLVEYSLPTTGYSGTVGGATELTEVRRWAVSGTGWNLIADTPAWWGGSGVYPGGIWWDEARQLLWYSAYPHYTADVKPFLGATQLLDTVTTGNYREVGARHGPWYYRSADVGTNFYKQVAHFISPIPEYARSDLGDRDLILGGTFVSFIASGHKGPGFHAFKADDILAIAANGIIPLGLRLADFSNESPNTPAECHRSPDYEYLVNEGTPMPNPVGGVGFWQESNDQAHSFAWVDSGTKHGILAFGMLSVGGTWYWQNPLPADKSIDGLEHIDPTEPEGASWTTWGYRAEGYRACLRLFDPDHARAVGRGERSCWNDGMIPTQHDWQALWPGIPVGLDWTGPGPFKPLSQKTSVAQCSAWDATAGELIWCPPDTWGGGSAFPTVQIFSIT